MAALNFLRVVAAASLVAGQVAYYNPTLTGGSMLTLQDEPLNMIISGLSTPEALTDQGILNFGNALGYDVSCLGLVLGTPARRAAAVDTSNRPQEARKPPIWVTETDGSTRRSCSAKTTACRSALASRPSSVVTTTGTVFRQNGTGADSGALFLAASKEDPIAESHDIVSNGYNLGRDEIVAAATAGTVSFNGVDYTTTVEYVTGLLQPGSAGINHNISIDGQVAVLTITAVEDNAGINCKGSSLCSVLPASDCSAAAAQIVNTTVYRTDETAAQTGVCSGHCGIFVQGTDCYYDGSSLVEAYAALRSKNCKVCGSQEYLNGCEITINYVSDC
ncbi:hypothetical protein HMN09_00045600 [Mycena chlorophos]|uniref:Uncharacterized protein n=1 Tax=Mycena chlorophos TaxID=658473 RepID=A0A8H6TT93_MYCCL|nr:hypothetical protein HMN09_00045600 [Mycena chlorophos]